MVAGVLIAVVLIVGGLWWYHSGATCRNARSLYKASLAQIVASNADFKRQDELTTQSSAAAGNDDNLIQTSRQLADNVVHENPACFSVTTRAVVGP